jgi:hypothetical protein
MSTDVKNIIERYKSLQSDRGTILNHWNECYRYCLPRKAYLNRVKTPGQKLDTDIYDSTAIQSNVILAAGLHGYLTNPATKWFAIRTQDRDLMKQKEVMLWLKGAEDKMHDVINSSNFAQQVHEVYLDLGSIGTACLYEDEDVKDIVRFYCFSMGDIFISENEIGEVDLVIRKTNLTVRQAYNLWKEKAGEAVKTAYEAKKYEEKTDIIQAVMPRYERDVSKADSSNMPFASVYIEVSKEHLIKEGGYQEFPFFVPKFTKESGETYGTSPAMVSLPDIKMLNAMSKVTIRAAQKVVDPPLVLPDDGFILPIKVNSGDINYRTPNGMNPNSKIEPLATGGQIGIGMEMENQRRETIKKNFFADLFLLLADNPNMTATEVLQRVQEKMLMLAPVLGRLMSELLDPIVERTFNIMFRLGLFGPPPAALSGIKYVIEYTSPLARAQKAEESKNLDNMVLRIGQLIAFKPEAADKLNVDEYINVAAELGSVNPRIILDDKEVAVLRKARNEAQAQQAELEQAAIAAKAGADGAIAVKTLAESQIVGKK